MSLKTRKEWFVVMATETADGDTVETCVILPSGGRFSSGS